MNQMADVSGGVEEMSMDAAVAQLMGGEAPPDEEREDAAPAATGDAAPAEAVAEAAETAEESEVETIEIDPDAELWETEFETAEGKQKTKLSLTELQKGYMLHKDYTRKTQELARQRESVQQEVAKTVTEKTDHYAQQLQLLAGMVMSNVAPELKDVNWSELAANDPAEYVRLSAKRDQVRGLMNQLQARHQEAPKTKDA